MRSSATTRKRSPRVSTTLAGVKCGALDADQVEAPPPAAVVLARPETVAQSAADLERLRRGHGSQQRREDLQRRLAQIHPALRDQSHRERLRLAQLRFQARSSDTRRPPPPGLQSAIETSAAKLAALDAQIIAALRRRR